MFFTNTNKLNQYRNILLILPLAGIVYKLGIYIQVYVINHHYS